MAAMRDGITKVVRSLAVIVANAAARLRPDALEKTPWDRSVLEDVAARRPWNLVVKIARLSASIRLRSLREGTTVVIVNWNTCAVTADVIKAVQRFSPPDVRVLVVDNGSSDGSREMLRRWAGVDTLLLRGNAGHGVALDIALCRVRTKIAVTLDSDAVPLGRGWLDPVVAPLQAGPVVLAGARSSRHFVHPIYLAVGVEQFVRRRLSFQVHRLTAVQAGETRWGENSWDTAELMTPRLASHEVAFVERTPNIVDGLPGMTAGGVVYHHGGVSRTSDGGVADDAFVGWRSACRSLGLDFLDG